MTEGSSSLFNMVGKKVPRQVWNEFRAAIAERYGSPYGRLNEHVELALKSWTEHLRRGDVEQPHARKSAIFGPKKEEG